jgi:type IV pilus assembly protein PilY1
MRLCQIAVAVSGVLGGAYVGWSANTDIANEPLTTGVSGVKPNLMFILDNSGSMARDYMPDWVNDSNPSDNSTTAGCFDSGDSGQGGDDDDGSSGSILGRRDACRIGDPPYMSSDVNRIYYNPAITYRPGLNADGSAKTNMNSANTSGWTAVPTDPYGQQQTDQLGNSVTTTNLVTGYPDRVWCSSTGAAANSAACEVNSAYTFPNKARPYGRDNSDNIKYLFGGPYYYTIQTAQYCTTAARTTCVSGSNIGPTTHTFQAPEFCTDAELTNCAAGAAVTAAHVFFGPRWCSDQTTLSTCQRKKIGNFIFPKHVGRAVSFAGTVPGDAATGTLTITQAAAGYQLSTLTVNGVAIIPGPVLATSSSTSTLANNIAIAINNFGAAPGYTATVSGSVVTIAANTPGSGPNGYLVTPTSTSAGTTAAQASITINSSTTNNTTITAITLNGSGNLMQSTCSRTTSNGVTVSGGTITATTNTSSAVKRQSVAAAVAACINNATGTNGGYSASINPVNLEQVLVNAPLSSGASSNGASIGRSGSIPVATAAFANGVTTGVLFTDTDMAGGSSPSVSEVRIGVGAVSRRNITPTRTTYPKANSRTDCAGTTCTYDEEMTNFANWYSYYRTRLQMMKSAAGRAFSTIDDTFRVGFITINPGAPVLAARYLKIDTFDATHKSNWYTKFYAQSVSGYTPLREALSRIGQLYAGPSGSPLAYTGLTAGIPVADDPIQYSCQPNYSILSTDGYWNGNEGKKIDGTSMTQQDNVNANYSKRAIGAFDGNPGSNTVGLADVALYYYQTDLRTGASDPKATNNVRAVGADTATHQHMTTYTIGLGLDGELTYRSDYPTANSGDFFDIKQGTKNWPVPASDSPSALDDLWHAAVNGRGLFFSANNAQLLSEGLTDALNDLRRTTGAGAAAATSNLQPVAGDNFAFTAQFATVEWSGDVLARTIDLSTGTVSTVPLWSARTLLDSLGHTARQIYTFDSTDAAGNKLKHFCFPQGGPAPTWCNDGAGLTAAEQALFAPSQLIQSTSWTAAQTANATAEKVINYVRGEILYEDTNALADTDLFRNRASILGDIINAQPVYVKSSSFDYTDTGYSLFKACTQGTTLSGCPVAQFPTPTIRRRPTVYVAANDGMLHAFETDVNNNPYYQTAGIGTTSTTDDTFTGNNTGNGSERWAYLPKMIMPNLYRLANQPYTHRYFTDGSPTVADICISNPCAGVNDWRTILVAGVNSGTRGLYALDVTNPLTPKGLWEFTVRLPSVTPCAATPATAVGATNDCDLGLSFGNPIVTKFGGQWVVMVSSGHNNTGPEPGTTNRMGDGKGYLYILNAVTGAIIQKIGTGVGDPGTAGANYADADPSGLSRLNAWLTSTENNTALAIYGGDLKGNLWRFDLDPSSSTYLTAVRVAILKDASNNLQPITTRPELTLNANRRVIFVATGKFLGTSDTSTTGTQTVYAISDDLAGNTAVTTRTPLVQQVMTTNSVTQTRTITNNAVDWTSTSVRGWYVDLPDSGERVNVDPVLQLGTLVVASNIPSSNTCTAGGTAWLNSFNIDTGSVVTSTSQIATYVASSLVVGVNVIMLPGSSIKAIVTTADNNQLTQSVPVVPTNFGGQRVSWRELDTTQ